MNRLQLLKTLAPGFLPLLVFIAADALWGTKVGLLVAVASGVLELAIAYIREKTWDRFVLLDTLLIVLMGGVSLLLDNDIFFRLKPAIVELVFCLVLGVSAYSPLNILLAMSRRYLKGVEIGAEQARAMTRSMKTLFFIFLGHTLLIVYADIAAGPDVLKSVLGKLQRAVELSMDKYCGVSAMYRKIMDITWEIRRPRFS